MDRICADYNIKRNQRFVLSAYVEGSNEEQTEESDSSVRRFHLEHIKPEQIAAFVGHRGMNIKRVCNRNQELVFQGLTEGEEGSSPSVKLLIKEDDGVIYGKDPCSEPTMTEEVTASSNGKRSS